MARERIFIVEDDPGLAELLVEELDAEGYQVRHQDSAEAAWPEIEVWQPELVISDLRLPGANGMSLIPKIKGLPVAPAMLLITAFGTVNQAVAALKEGADDFLTKPLDMEHLLLTVAKLLNHRRLTTMVATMRAETSASTFHGMFGKSRAMRGLYQQIEQVAGADTAVLILGESGTGKELVARAIHAESQRAEAPFLAVNCAGIPAELMESEFFGHAAGAFTGAQKARAGLLKEAEGGTLLLDEIGEMPLKLQAKLLRVLQEGTMRPVGSDKEISVNVRLLAATHRDLEAKVQAGEFREDLFYRLETLALQVPPLRERADDRELLAQQFLADLTADKEQQPIFSAAAMDCLYQYPFPGNVRELHNAIERAVTFCNGNTIEKEHLPERIQQYQNDALHELSADANNNGLSASPKEPAKALRPLSEVQQEYVRYVLRETSGNKRKAAEILGVTRRTLYRWLAEDGS